MATGTRGQLLLLDTACCWPSNARSRPRFREKVRNLCPDRHDNPRGNYPCAVVIVSYDLIAVPDWPIVPRNSRKNRKKGRNCRWSVYWN